MKKNIVYNLLVGFYNIEYWFLNLTMVKHHYGIYLSSNKIIIIKINPHKIQIKYY